MLEPTSLTILGLSAGSGAGAAKFFLEKVLGPPTEALGQGLAAPLLAWKERRIKNAMSVLDAASEVVDRAGKPVQPVPGRILMPLLERASVEEHPDLQARWVRLLANASVGLPVLPSFVSILGELSPDDARVLDHVYRIVVEDFADWQKEVKAGRAQVSVPTQLKLNVGNVEKELTGHITLDIHLLVDNLERLALVTRNNNGKGFVENYNILPTRVGIVFVSMCWWGPDQQVRTDSA